MTSVDSLSWFRVPAAARLRHFTATFQPMTMT
jgi:hypothetical protein